MEARILHVEDNPDDVMLTRLAFRKAGIAAKIEVATDGESALAVLAKCQQPPAFVLLDVKLPSMSGLELLGWIRSQPHLKRLPVIMLTSSGLPGDINKAYDLGANSFLIKPANLDRLIELAKTMDLYWLRTNTPAVPVAA